MEKALKIIFILMLVALALGDLGRVQFENGVAITFYDVMVGFFVLFGLSFIKWKNVFSNKLFKPIVLFVGIGFASLILNLRFIDPSDFFVSALYLLRFIFYVGIYFVVASFDSRFKKRTPFIMILIGGVFIVLPGYIQYFLYPDLRNLYYLGWDEHLYRLVSSFFDPNFAASVLSLLLILIFAVQTGKARWVFAGLTFAALLLTYSRSGCMMFFVGMASLLILLNQKKYLVGLLGVLILGLLLLPKNLEGEGVKLLRTASFFNRLESTQQAIKIIKDHPILGVGFNAYRYAQYRYGFLKGENWRITHSGAGTDNSFLFILATTGIVGFISYLYLWFEVVKKAYRGRFSSAISVVLLASVAGLVVNAFFINSLFYPFIMAWMWILVGLMENS